MPTGIDPRVDYAFKFVFGRESNTDILTAFLNAIVPWIVEHVQLRDPFTGKEDLDDKLSVLDILCFDQLQRLYDVEMQMVLAPALPERSLLYWARMFAGQLTAGQKYHELRPAVSIWIVNGVVFKDSPRWIHRFELCDRTEPELRYTDHLQMIIIELGKFQVAPDDLNSEIEKWLYFLKHGKDLDVNNLPAKLDTPAIRKAMEELTRLSHDELEKRRYEQRERGLREWEMVQTVSREAGRAEGRVEGIELGRTEGRNEARREDLVRLIQFCQEMLQQPISPTTEFRTLSLTELQNRANALQAELRNRQP